MRSVEVDKAKYVCGSVNAKDKADAYAGAKAFVYTVSIDFARIDDDGEIATRHDAYRAYPISEEEKREKAKKLEISPRQLEMMKALQKAVPSNSDTSLLTNMSSQLSPATAAPGGTTQQQLQKSGTPAGSSGQQAQVTFKATAENEMDWRDDRPPAAWPVFPGEHVLSKPGRKRSNPEAIEAAKQLEQRWVQSKGQNATARPSVAEIDEVLRSLLLVDLRSAEFPQAWAAFVRLKR